MVTMRIRKMMTIMMLTATLMEVRLMMALMRLVSRQQKRVKQRKLELDCRFETNARLQIITNTINKQINTNTNKAC